MNAYQKKQKRKKRNGIFRKWHRRAGFAASLFLFNLAVTGILLNHYESFGFHKSYVTSDWLLDLYGISSPENTSCFQTETMTACQLGQFIYINEEFFQETSGRLLNLVTHNEQTLLATSHHITLLTPDARLIDSISTEETLGKTIEYVGVSSQQIIASNNDGRFSLDLDMLEWSVTETQHPLQQPVISKADNPEKLKSDYRQRQITHLKLVQDLHSGRILNISGQTVNDIAAIVLIILAISGFITWQRRLNKPRD